MCTNYCTLFHADSHHKNVFLFHFTIWYILWDICILQKKWREKNLKCLTQYSLLLTILVFSLFHDPKWTKLRKDNASQRLRNKNRRDMRRKSSEFLTFLHFTSLLSNLLKLLKANKKWEGIFAEDSSESLWVTVQG